ncbi:unnamed protein product, partial [Medioppia subpectinata]
MSSQSAEESSAGDDLSNGLDAMRVQCRAVGATALDVLVMSESGKPVYCYSRREDWITLTGVCVALIHVTDSVHNDTIRHIQTASGLKITFSHKSPLIICLVYRINTGIDSSIVINQVNAQIISILTAKTLKSVFEQRQTFDLKRLLSGSEKLIDTLIDVILTPIDANKCDQQMAKSHNKPNQVNAYLTSSTTTFRTINTQSVVNTRNHITGRAYIPVRLLSTSLRESVYNIITSCASSAPNVVFSLLFSVDKRAPKENDNTFNNNEIQLILVCNHNSKARINALDIQLIYSLVIASESQLS